MHVHTCVGYVCVHVPAYVCMCMCIYTLYVVVCISVYVYVFESEACVYICMYDMYDKSQTTKL